MKRKKQPMQPVVRSPDGMMRFQENRLVRALLDWSTSRGFGMNELAMIDARLGDHEQFAQLIGYSISGFGELSYVRDSTYNRARIKAEKERAKG